MIYYTTVTFIFTLFLTQISCALPQACSNHISPISNLESVQHRLQYGEGSPTFTSLCDPAYDKPDGSMHTVACADPLEKKYPLFHDIPTFPNIGAAFDVKEGTPSCGECWEFTNHKNRLHIYLTAINSTFGGFKMSVSACNTLKIDEKDIVDIRAGKVDPHFCGF